VSEIVELEIERLGARGDGIARHRGRTVYVPFTAPGDRVRATLTGARGEGVSARLIELLRPSDARAVPSCRHFGTCGGCAFQHVAADAYAAAKRSLVVEALARHGLGEAPVEPLQRLPPGTRRRARFAVEGGRIGFQARASHRLVALEECAVLAPAIVALLPALRRLRNNAGFSVTLADTGLDVVAERQKAPDLGELEALAAFAEANDLARLSWRLGDETVPVAQRRPVRVALHGVPVDLPPDAFLQATPEAEAALAALVLARTEGAARVADLFAGIGTFTFALAGSARVHAVEGAAPALAALRGAANRAGLARVSAEARDLEARPLLPEELAAYDAVVFDPPRAGAKAQAEALARSSVPRVVAVSCNPATFARDAAALVAGGYRLECATPVDQFVWSPHVELVAAFAR
jgi:23S rRNA (uracil1939-C5)-methyltransferase